MQSLYIKANTKNDLYASPKNYFQLNYLREIWEKSPDNEGNGKKEGIDGITPSIFKKKFESNLKQIQADIQQGKYKFQPLKAIFKQKGNGKERVICIPTVRDRLVQRVIESQLNKKMNDGTYSNRLGISNPICFGVKGKTYIAAVEEAIELRKKRPWVLKTDIQSFFDTINKNVLLLKIEKKLKKNFSLIPPIEQIINCEINKNQWNRQKRRLEKQGLRKEIGLRQGMPLSPLLANFFLKEFDHKMEKILIREKKLGIIRYVDDLIVFCHNKEECEQAKDFIEAHLRDLALEIPKLGTQKTSIVSPNESVLFLGINIKKDNNKGYIKVIPENSINGIIKELKDQYFNLDCCLKKGLTLSKVVLKLSHIKEGYRNSYQYTNNLDDFITEYDNVSDRIIKNLLISTLGENVFKSLNSKEKKFLGLPKNF